MSSVYREVTDRFREQGIQFENKRVLIIGRGITLDGEEISGISVSQDGRWVCLPVYDDKTSAFTGEYEYKPHCYEILEKYQCYTGQGVLALTDVWLLK